MDLNNLKKNFFLTKRISRSLLVHKWLYVHMFYQVIVLFWTLNSFHLLTGIFIPMVGRSGGERNPEIIVAAICLAVTIYSISFIVRINNWLSMIKGNENEG